ncbi:non-ribosomal peptide synthetase [Photorhabdus laumondii]|uniref:Carrier domain-containing protein n=1 Tax=Photorhabdus laumondii subsp. clarkei TaxID=2029685 RepID=A0A329VID0_9GAMM|nr:non-ribosomal peptide synthetase [Photorhabdus laumondii]RAW91688.1 hypothetical protein CKY01_07395 [Photorhabdus laumondii subsp. clarkei]
MTTMKLIDREYWLMRVGDLTKAAAATADIFPHHEGSLVSAQCPLSSAVTDRLKQVAGNSELLTWAILAAVTSIVLRRIGGVSSVVLHINTEQGKRLPVLLTVPPAVTFREWLSNVRMAAVEAINHGSIDKALLMPFLEHFMPIVVNCAQTGTGIVIELIDGVVSVSGIVAEAQTLHHLATGIATLLNKGLFDLDICLNNMAIVDDAMQTKLLARFNSQPDYSSGKSFYRLVLEQAESNPHAIALRDKTESLTYRELFQLALSVALKLKNAGISADDIVALSAPRSARFIAVATGILFSGGAYLPIDPTLPKVRQQHMLKHAKALIADHVVDMPQIVWLSFNELSFQSQALVDGDEIKLLNQQVTEPSPSELAYVIFTSGSTGFPKGVGIEHRSFLNLLAFRVQNCELKPGVVLPQTAPISFDISVWQMFTGLTAGATVSIVSDDVVKDPQELIQYIIEQEFEYIELVPSLIAVILDILEKSISLKTLVQRQLRGMISTGEVLNTELARRWHQCIPTVTLLNAYGPAECTDDVTQGRVEEQFDGLYCPVGTPLPNVTIYVLDKDFQLVPPMVGGEIFIGGPNVGRGYIGSNRFTAAAFLPDPFLPVPGARMYRTGDRGRWREDGILECFGRTDNQVKIRGRRVELGEIEAVLANHPGVAMCTVELVDMGGFEQLSAFVTQPSDAVVDASSLSKFLAEQLPDYMVPSRFYFLDALLCNANGKVDRKQLKALAKQQSESASYIAPRTRLEQQLCDLWCKYLKLTKVGIMDDFFALGGDSIIGIRLIHEAGSLGINLRPRHVLEHPTIASLAKLASTKGEMAANSTPRIEKAPLTPIQQWFFEQRFSEQHHWNQSHVISTKEQLNAEALSLAIQLLVEHHEQLRVCFPKERGKHYQALRSPYDNLLWFAEPDCSEETIANEAHASLSIEEGPLLRIVMLDDFRVLLTLHHLIVDQVSWQILLEDLETAYQAMIQKEMPRLPRKSTQYLYWSQQQTATSPQILPPIQLTTPIDVVQVNSHVSNLYGKRSVAEVKLSESETQYIQEISALVPNGGIPAVLLTGLANTIAVEQGNGQLLLELEGYGRQEENESIDVMRTVGWFTTIGPFVLPVNAMVTVVEVATAMIEANPYIKTHLQQTYVMEQNPNIGFNYLGRFNTKQPNDGFFSVEEDIGMRRAATGHRPLEWEINAAIVDGKLTITLEYIPFRHNEAAINALLAKWKGALTKVRHAPNELSDLAPLTPAQHAFFERDNPNENHCNHGVLFTLSRTLSLETVEQAAAALLARFPILGASFMVTTLGRWQGINPQARIAIEQFELQQIALNSLSQKITELANIGHKSLDLLNGPICRIQLYRTAHNLPDKLLIIVHHLVVDPYSWDLLTEDLAALLGGAEAHELDIPTTSYLAWARRLHRLVQDDPALFGVHYWLSQPYEQAQQLVSTDAIGIEANRVEQTTVFDEVQTQQFLKPSEHSQLPVLARLLTLLARSLESHFLSSANNILVELGGHGREDLFDEVDLGRTIGWFTCGFPFLLPFSMGRSFDEHATDVARLLREVPVRGFGFEALRYLSVNPKITEKLKAIPRPQLRLDFEGELLFLNTPDEEKVNPIFIDITTEGTGYWKPRVTPMDYLLCFNISVNDGQMEIRAQFAGDVMPKEQIKTVLSEFNERITHKN